MSKRRGTGGVELGGNVNHIDLCIRVSTETTWTGRIRETRERSATQYADTKGGEDAEVCRLYAPSFDWRSAQFGDRLFQPSLRSHA